MQDWINAVLPVASALAGSALTLAGQSLSDRRAHKHAREARREDFKISNFDMHRSALIELQDKTTEFFWRLIGERIRREQQGDNEFFQSNPFAKIDSAIGGVVTQLERNREFIRIAKSLKPREVGKKATARARETESSTSEMNNVLIPLLREGTRIMKERHPFIDERDQIYRDLRRLSHRSGSNSVIDAAEAFLQSVNAWDGAFGSENEDELMDAVRSSYNELDRSIGNALTLGPFDTYKPST